MTINRRTALKAGAALAASAAIPAWAQAKTKLRFAAVFSDKDIRADMIGRLQKDIAGDFDLEPFYNASLFKQGTELVACSATTSSWATSRRRTSPSRYPRGASSPRLTCSATPITCSTFGRATSARSTRSRRRSR